MWRRRDREPTQDSWEEAETSVAVKQKIKGICMEKDS